MVGSELPSPETRESTVTDTPVLTVRDLKLTATDTDGVVRDVLDGISFTIHQGEVLGIAGVEGNGQAELVEAVMGMRDPDSGTITLDGADISHAPTRKRRERGIGYIPEDRHRHGLLLEAPLWENRMLGHVTEAPNSRHGLIDGKGARLDTERIVREYDVRTPGIEVTAASLSGGNQQKLIVGREMSHTPKLLIAAHPTRGVDVGAQAQIWDQIRAARREGLAVLLDLRRPGRADRPVRHPAGDVSRPSRRRRRPRHDHPRGVGLRHDRRGQRPPGSAPGYGGRGPMKKLTARFDKERLLLAVAAPVLAMVAALIVTALVILATGKNPFDAFNDMLSYGSASDSQVYILNKATTYYLAGVAVAIGFRMNLFNIGVDGQYRIAAFFAAVVGGALHLPGIIQIPIVIIVAMLVGAMWSGIAGILKTSRGVSEVISTIMLNSIATAIIGYLIQPEQLGQLDDAGNLVSTSTLPESSWFFSLDMGPAGELWGFIFIAVLAGLAYWFILGRTRFGYDLRAVGRSETAAAASGVSVKKMIVTSMVLSGATAGLIGMPTLLNDSHAFSNNFPLGIGFTGIAIALLGRNHPIGIALAALLWGYLERTTNHLEFRATTRRSSA